MVIHRKTLSLLAIAVFAIITTAANINKQSRYKNLKILPQDITQRNMDSIMNAYCSALHVSCDFCHIPAKKNMFSFTPASDTLDFSLDGEMKENARRMIRITMDINTRYFYFDSTIKPIYLNVVNCNTCHRGNAFPMEK